MKVKFIGTLLIIGLLLGACGNVETKDDQQVPKVTEIEMFDPLEDLSEKDDPLSNGNESNNSQGDFVFFDVLDQNGGAVLYKHEGDMCLADRDGNFTFLAADDANGRIVNGKIAENHSTISYYLVDLQTEGLGELWVVNANGTNTKLVSSREDFNYLSPFEVNEVGPDEEPPDPSVSIDPGVVPVSLQWLGGSQQMVFGTWNCCYGAISNDDLHIVDVETREITTFLGRNEGGKPYVSPNLEYIALANPKWIGIIHSDGSNFRNDLFTIDEISTDSEFRHYPFLEWEPDSSTMYIGIHGTNGNGDRIIELWEIDLDGNSNFVKNIEPPTYSFPDYLSSNAEGRDPDFFDTSALKACR